MARKLGLTRRDVVEAADAIADRDGLDNLSLRAVADALGVRSPSLYAHIDGLAGLRRLLSIEGARRLGRALVEAAEGMEGDDALHRFAAAARRFATEHPGLYDASQLAVRAGEDDEVYAALAEPVAVIAAALTAAGHEGETVIPLIRGLRAAVHGFVLLERSAGFGMPEDVDESFRTMIEVFIAGMGTRLG